MSSAAQTSPRGGDLDRPRVLTSLNRSAVALDRFWFPGLSLLVLAYAAMMVRYSRAKLIWHDEIFTLVIASAPTLGRMWHEIATIDLNPPLSYLLTRWSIRAFGSGDLALRLPSIAGFLLAWVSLFFYVRRRMSTPWAFAAVLLFWNTVAFGYAWEARPYALMLGLTSALIWCWSLPLSWEPGRSRPERDVLAAVGIFVLGVALLSTHMLALFGYLPVVLTQGVRSLRLRRPEVGMSVALLLPLPLMFAFARLTSHVGRYLYPAATLPTLSMVSDLYVSFATSILLPLLLLLFCSLLLPSLRDRVQSGVAARPVEEVVLWTALALSPVAVLVALRVRHVGFGERYFLLGTLGLTLVLPSCSVSRIRGSPAAGALAAVMFFLFFHRSIGHNGHPGEPVSRSSFVPLQRSLSQIEIGSTGLPIVVAHADGFVELDYREDPAFASRTYFLMSRPDAIRYAQLTLYEEEIAGLARVAPLHAHVEDYSDFLAQHHHFLVLSTSPESPYDGSEWVVRKLMDQGANLRLLGKTPPGYTDSLVYDVTLAPR